MSDASSVTRWWAMIRPSGAKRSIVIWSTSNRRPVAARPKTFVAVRPDIEPAWANACSTALGRARIQLDVVQETDTKLAMLGLVAAGAGMGIVSESMQCLAREGVVFRDVTDLAVRVPLVMLHRERASPRAAALLQVCSERKAR